MCVNPIKGYVDYKGSVVKACRQEPPVFVNGTPYYKYIDLPCRCCVECYTAMRREWTARALAEAQVHDRMCYLTLTYSDDNLQFSTIIDDDGVIYKHATLNHRHWQLFMYRLRQFFSDRELRFFMCGEYGTKTFRPHYHAVVYGIDPIDFTDLKFYKLNKSDDFLFVSDRLDLNLWQLGQCTVGECNSEVIGYVAGYVSKKFTVIRGKEFYKLTGIVPPYVRSSNRPGLGVPWLLDNIERFKDVYDYVSVSNGLSNPSRIYLTENWKNKFEKKLFETLDIDDIISYNDNKIRHRVEFNDQRLSLELARTDLSKEQYLADKSRQIKMKIDMKVRDF